MQQVWGTGQFLGPFVPTTTSTDSGMACVARFERHGASPAAAYAIIRMAAATEVRGLCPAVHAPSLVLHRRDDVLVSPANSRYLAEHLPAARYAELEGVDHAPWVGDSEPFFAEVDQFLSSDHPPLSGPGPAPADLALGASLDLTASPTVCLQGGNQLQLFVAARPPGSAGRTGPARDQ